MGVAGWRRQERGRYLLSRGDQQEAGVRHWGSRKDEGRDILDRLIWIVELPPSFLPHLWYMEIPRLGVKSELQLLAYTTATANTFHSF